MIESLLEAIDHILSQGKFSWGAVITALLFFNKIQRNKEFRLRDQRVERNQQRIMAKLGVEGEWASDSQRSGLKYIYPKLISYLQMVTIHQKRRVTKMQFLKSSISKKLFTILMGVAVTALNNKFNLQISENDIYIMFAGIITYIVGQSHVDGKKAIANTVSAIAQGVQASIPNIEPMPAYATFQEAIPSLQIIHEGINKLLIDVKKDDASQAFKDAMQAYAQIKPIIDSLKHPEPVATILVDQVAV